MSQLILYQQAAAPAVPAAGSISLFAKTDDRLYWAEDDGDVHKLAHSGEAETFLALTATTASFTKATAGDVVTFTNTAGSITGYLSANTGYVFLGGAASAGGAGYAVFPGTSAVIYSPNQTKTLTVANAGTTIVGLLQCTNDHFLILPTLGTSAAYGQIVNTGGTLYFGVDNSTGTSFGTGGNYGAFIYRATGTTFVISRDSTVDLSISTAGVVTVPAAFISNASISAGTYAKTGTYTVAGLPAAATAGIGAIAFVSDANTTFILGLGIAVVGGGTNKVPVYSDGTNWIVG